MSNSKESVNELDLTSYKGVMLGANAISRGREGLPPSKVVAPGSAADSPRPSDNGDGTETLNYRRSQAVAGAAQGFLRVEVSETP